MAALAENAARGEPPILEWGLAARALEGERESGDLHVVIETPHGALLAVIDGLGHGEEAAVVARRAAKVLASHATEAPDDLLRRCHEELTGTRGAVATVGSLSARDETIAWAGVGNVQAVLLRASAWGDRGHELAAPRGGILGFRLPPLRPSVHAVRAGDLLVLATDGVRLEFDRRISERASPQPIADRILAEQATLVDDGLVLVARYLGARG